MKYMVSGGQPKVTSRNAGNNCGIASHW